MAIKDGESEYTLLAPAINTIEMSWGSLVYQITILGDASISERLLGRLLRVYGCGKLPERA